MPKPDGGPAFPVDPNSNWVNCGGLSVRDYFAIRFAAGMCSRDCMTDFLTDEGLSAMAEEAYKRADAMLMEGAK